MNNIFIWIPKTGGTSLYNALQEKINMKLYVEGYNAFDNTGNVSFGHADVSCLIAKKIIHKEYWSNSICFTVVRNPYSRFISLYNDFKISKRISNISLKEFANIIMHFTRKPGFFNVMDYSQAASQIKWILPGVIIFRFEEMISVENVFDIKIKQENQGTFKNWINYYNAETLKMITDIYYDDLTLLNYNILT